MVSGGTDNHLMLVDLRSVGITGKELEHRLDEVHITVNKNTIPNDPESPFVTSGIRIGTPAVTSRGFVEEDMKEVAALIKLADINNEIALATKEETELRSVREELKTAKEDFNLQLQELYLQKNTELLRILF